MALGKNFNDILGDYFGDETVNLNNPEKDDNIVGFEMIDIESIDISPYQTRVRFDEDKIKSLAKSIKKSGLLSPVIVLKKGNQNFVLLAGERRLRAVKKLKQDQIPAIVKTEKDLNKQEQALITATENLQREDLSALELGKTYEMLMNIQGINESQLAKELDSTTQYVKNYTRLLTLGGKVKNALLDKQIGEGHARHLVGLAEERQEYILDQIINKDLTVKQIEKLARGEKLEEESKQVSFSASPSSHNLSPVIMKRVINFADKFPNPELKTTGDDKKGKIVIKWDETK